ncbi:hypothetical protein [Nocardia fusca]|uniref:hypothetical protein n=1 Tax=Nocardia fusca TaxID=941183 RepID=UPI0007A750C3|nr:hypothetical protein [Nocardia fusca]
MSGSLDEVWQSVQGVLGTAAKDAGTAISALPAQVAGGLNEVASRVVKADSAEISPPATTSFEMSGGVAGTASSSTYVPGRDLIDEVDYSALRRAGRPRSLGNSPTFEEIQRLQGFDGPVTVATRGEVDGAVAAGQRQLFRGFEEDRYLDAFITGPVRPGGGPTGSGTYVTPLEHIALDYTDPTRTLDRATRQARVLRMALRPGTKTITLRELEKERSQAWSQVTRELEAVRGIANRTDEENARYAALQDKELTFADIGQYGALRGWDAIDGSATFSNKEWVVLNPTALLVQRREP